MSTSDSPTAQTEEPTPAGREQVTAAVLAATERLSATGQPSSFTVRQIAAEAGVTTSLLYFYFKSKDDIILATVRSISARIDVAVAKHTEVGDISSATSRMLAKHPAFPRLLAWLILEGRSFSELSDDPFLNRLVRMFAVGDSSDPDTDAGAVVAMLLGNALFRGNINAALGRPGDDERLIQALDQARVGFVSRAVEQSTSEAPQAG
jgi:AcrR family transcriptional regulator